MKTGRNMAVLFSLVFLLATGFGTTAFAGNGSGAMDGTGPLVSIFDGTPVTVSGIVTSVGTEGQGLAIDTGDQIVTVFGIGPVKYWDAASVPRPQVGEEITVSGYEVTFSDGSVKTIATSITVEGQTIELRNPDDGSPAWRGSMGQGAAGQMNR